MDLSICSRMLCHWAILPLRMIHIFTHGWYLIFFHVIYVIYIKIVAEGSIENRQCIDRKYLFLSGEYGYSNIRLWRSFQPMKKIMQYFFIFSISVVRLNFNLSAAKATLLFVFFSASSIKIISTSWRCLLRSILWCHRSVQSRRYCY